jgi:hypothetical protein
MSALDSVLADLVESDRECGYVTVRREPLEALIEEWLARGDQMSLLWTLLARAQKELTVAWAPRVMTQPIQRSQETILHELNSATAQSELAERLESERQTVQIVIAAIDATVNRLMAQELAKVGQERDENASPSAQSGTPKKI